MNNNLAKMNEARLEKALNKLYNFSDCGVMTLREFFEKNPPVYKHIYIQKYSEHRICLEYKKLETPKIHYEIFYTENICIDVPKMVYDYYEDVPER